MTQEDSPVFAFRGQNEMGCMEVLQPFYEEHMK